MSSQILPSKQLQRRTVRNQQLSDTWKGILLIWACDVTQVIYTKYCLTLSTKQPYLLGTLELSGDSARAVAAEMRSAAISWY